MQASGWLIIEKLSPARHGALPRDTEADGSAVEPVMVAAEPTGGARAAKPRDELLGHTGSATNLRIKYKAYSDKNMRHYSALNLKRLRWLVLEALPK